MIKINKTGIYSKALECWNAKDAADIIIWANFITYMIEEYEKLLRKGGGTTLGQEGYDGAFNAPEDIVNALLVENIVQYAEHTSTVESKVSELESSMSMMEMNGGPQPHIHPNQVA